jgi:hypothetical protein
MVAEVDETWAGVTPEMAGEPAGGFGCELMRPAQPETQTTRIENIAMLVRFRWNRVSRLEKFMDAVCLVYLEQRNRFENPPTRVPPGGHVLQPKEYRECGADLTVQRYKKRPVASR